MGDGADLLLDSMFASEYEAIDIYDLYYRSPNMALPKKKKPAVKKKKTATKAKKTPTKKTTTKKASAKPDKKAFKVTAGHKKKWQKAREQAASDSNGFQEDDRIDPGDYIARITRANHGTIGTGEHKGNLYAGLTLLIMNKGDFENCQISSFFDLDRYDWTMEAFARQMKGTDLWDISDFNIEDVPEACAELNKLKPKVRINVSHSQGNDGREYQNFFVNGAVKD